MLDRIKLLINREGTTMSAVESALGFGNGTIGKWATKSPTCNKLQDLANYFNVSVEYILNGKESSDFLSDEERMVINKFRLLSDKDKFLFTQNFDSYIVNALLEEKERITAKEDAVKKSASEESAS